MRSYSLKKTEIITYLKAVLVKLRLKDLITASESPKGFAILAGLGLLLIAAGNASVNLYDWATYSATDAEQASYAATNPAVVKDEPAPKSDVTPQAAPKERSVETFTLKRGETLIGLLSRAGFDRANAHTAVNALDKVTNLRRLQRGQEIRIKRTVASDNTIGELWIRDAFDDQAYIARDETRYSASRQPIETLPLTHLVSGMITDNLYLSAKRAGLPDKVIIDLIRMMSFDIDFEREIRVGDNFQVYFERRYAPDFDDTENGRILHVNLGLQRRTVDATWYADDKENGDYFDNAGESTRRALMKTPLDVAVVTSSYGQRKHPVLGYTRMHKGVDFRAPTGTPIMAAGDGVIEMAARNGSYGNYIRIRHNGQYKTAYGHLSRYGKGVKKGRRVKQGQIIGYSGATGRVTAAHLHYEVLLAGKQTNPLKLKLPTGKTLKGKALEDFKTRRGLLVADMMRIEDRDARMANLLPADMPAR